MNGNMKLAAGILIGAAVGTGVALLVSPNSGRKNRAFIAKKSKALSKEARKAAEAYLAKARKGYNDLVESYAEKGKRTIDNGKEMVTV